MSRELPLGEAVALGAIQGPTELLPVSSSGHLVLVPSMLGWRYRELDPELRKSFEVALHAGGAVALLIGLRREVAAYARSFGIDNLVNLALSFTPAALAALAFERPIERHLSEPGPVAIALIVGAVAMAAADGFPEERDRHDATPADANVISRQIALPVILGAATLKGVRLARRGLPPGVGAGMLAGAGAAFLSTLASLRLITMLERSRSLLPYAVYRAALGVLALGRASCR
jgi:undecaprenyl-diphosphatase